ncbi:hypothetical protein BGX38DRAFT_1144898 [Terfezia claveryi]|nr:hypothetical protein BGX38DRAFT_1144898 [Terfezia claveryi]
MDPPQRPTNTVRGRSESEQTDFQLREGTQYFFRMRFLFLSCRLIQCITASVILFFPKTAFSHFPGVSYELMVVSDPELLTQYGFNLGISHRLGLHFSITLFATWLVFLITSIMEVSLVCIFNHLQNELRSRITMQEDLGEETTEIPIQRPLPTAIKQKTPHVRRVRRNVTVESVEDSTDLARNPENQDTEDLSSIAIVRRQDPTHPSQATTIAEILQEPVSRPRT